MIQTRVSSRALTAVHDGVYVVGGPDPIPLGDETAALLAVGDDSILSHLTAGMIWEIIVVPVGMPIHVTSPHSRLRRKGVVVHRSRTLHPVDTRVRDGLPVTSVARTLLDLAEILTTRDTERAVDEALGRQLVTLRELGDVIERNNGRKGAGILRRFVEWRVNNSGSRTKWERMAAQAFRAANFPPFEQNVRYLGFQHDFLWREHGVALEIDGSWHNTRLTGEKDAVKSKRLKDAGLDPNMVTNTDVEERIFEVVAHMAVRLWLRDPARRDFDEPV
jgi:very-short-patch-repair endonuclease